MAKLTLLEMVQDILSDINSDEVNNIADTTEALQVAQIIKTTYFSLITEGDWPHLRQLDQLDATTTATPTHMKMPENVQSIEWIKYNKKTTTDTADSYSDVGFLLPDDFLSIVLSKKATESTVDKVTDLSAGVDLYITNNKAPSYWTSFDDEYIVFDSYDSEVDSLLQNSKTTVMLWREPTFTITDSFVPDLPMKAFPYLLSEAKSVCFERIAQEASGKEEQRASRQKRRMSQDKWRHNGGMLIKRFGRK